MRGGREVHKIKKHLGVGGRPTIAEETKKAHRTSGGSGISPIRCPGTTRERESKERTKDHLGEGWKRFRTFPILVKNLSIRKKKPQTEEGEGPRETGSKKNDQKTKNWRVLVVGLEGGEMLESTPRDKV